MNLGVSKERQFQISFSEFSEISFVLGSDVDSDVLLKSWSMKIS